MNMFFGLLSTILFVVMIALTFYMVLGEQICARIDRHTFRLFASGIVAGSTDCCSRL